MATRQPNFQDHESTTDWAKREIAGSFSDPAEAAERLRMAAEHCHLIGGAAMCPLIEGHEIVIAVVPINREQCYPTNNAAKGKAPRHGEVQEPPKWGIGKADLMTIATAAAVEWTYSKRQDDARDPRYCHWKVRGHYRLIDGTFREIEGDRDIDARDNSDEMASKTDNQIAAIRETLVRNAITKSKLRAIREGFGIPHAMGDEDLKKPFVLSRMIFTGRSADPEVRRLFAGVIAQQQLAASAALYGRGVVPMIASPASVAPVGALGPAPVTMHEIEEPPESEPAPAPGSVDEAPPTPRSPVASPSPPPRSPAAAPPPPPPPAATQSRSTSAPRKASPPRGGWVMPGKPGKGNAGKPLSEADDRSLEWWIDRLQSNLDNGDTPKKYVERDRGLLAAMREELDRRHGVVPDDEEPEFDDEERY